MVCLQVYKIMDVGVNNVIFFPTSSGNEAFNPNGLVPWYTYLLRENFSHLVNYKVNCQDRFVAYPILTCHILNFDHSPMGLSHY
jgi:hypothetical protein